MRTSSAVDTAAVYAYMRISQDRDGTLVSVDNQRAELHQMAARLGLSIDREFVDNDISAYSGRERPAYRELVQALRRGPSVVLVWHMDRLYRSLSEFVALYTAIETHPVRIEAVRGGSLDLSTHEGKLQASFLVSFAEYDSAHKSDRVKMAACAAAKAGTWHGPRRFGFQLDGHGSATADPVEGPVIREIVDRFLAGESILSITRRLNDGEVPPLHGGIWHTNTVRQTLASPRIAGLRSYAPRLKGVTESIFRDVIGPARWPGIITVEEYGQVISLLKHPARKTTREGQNLLSGIATCARCGAGLVIASNATSPDGRPRRRYVCKKVPGMAERGGLSVEQHALDALVTEAVIRRLAATPVPPASGTVNGALFQAVAVAQERLDALARELGSGGLGPREYRIARDAARVKAEQAERALARATSSRVTSGLPLGDEAALRALWAERLTMGQQRAIIKALIEALVIHPAKGPSRSLDPGRVDLRWQV